MHPDFIFFHEINGKVVASILDPHGHHLDDALMKLIALAGFADEFGKEFHRIESLAEVDGRMRVLDMQDKTSRETVLAATGSAIDLYRSSIAVDYDAEPDLFR